jgi:hypothetical protein
MVCSLEVEVPFLPVTWSFLSAPGRIRTFAHGLGNRCSIP